MKFPLTAIVSILHRLSGVLLFLCIPFLLHYLSASLASQASYVAVQECFGSPTSKLIIFILVSGLLYHLVAGVRHLLMDLGIGETASGGRKGAWGVMVITGILVLLAGISIW